MKNDNFTYEAALEFLNQRKLLGMRFQTNRMTDILKELHDPQKKCSFIHVAGTNGKGSTIAFLRQLFQCNGRSVGTFTSPYMNSYLDHFQYNGEEMPKEDFVRLMDKVKPIVEKMDQLDETYKATEFEILTIVMFLYFSEKVPDIVLVEVGLGGLLDATNVLTPQLSVITSIGMDHVAVLGDNLEAIAFQKAGIIKEGIPVVLGEIAQAPLQVISNVAKEKHSKVLTYWGDYSFDKVRWKDRSCLFDYQGMGLKIEDMKLNMLGLHQVKNACVAISAYLSFCLDNKMPVDIPNIRQAIEKTNWQGRLEIVSESPLILLDGAHNVDGMKVLLEVLKQQFKDYRIHYLYAALENKDTNTMIALLDEVSNIDMIFTEFAREGVDKASVLAAKSKKGGRIELDYWKEIESFLKSNAKDEVLLIGGSLYFISILRGELVQRIAEKS